MTAIKKKPDEKNIEAGCRDKVQPHGMRIISPGFIPHHL